MKCILVTEEHTEPKEPREIVAALRKCAVAMDGGCIGCPYYDIDGCIKKVKEDAADLIENLIEANKDQSEKLKKIREWLEEKERK